MCVSVLSCLTLFRCFTLLYFLLGAYLDGFQCPQTGVSNLLHLYGIRFFFSLYQSQDKTSLLQNPEPHLIFLYFFKCEKPPRKRATGLFVHIFLHCFVFLFQLTALGFQKESHPAQQRSCIFGTYGFRQVFWECFGSEKNSGTHKH